MALAKSDNVYVHTHIYRYVHDGFHMMQKEKEERAAVLYSRTDCNHFSIEILSPDTEHHRVMRMLCATMWS